MFTQLSIDGKRVPLIRQPTGRLRLAVDAEKDDAHRVILTLEVERHEDGSLGFWLAEYQGSSGTEPWRVQGRVPGAFPDNVHKTAPEPSSGDSEG